MNNRQDKCCKYREEIKRKSVAKRKKKAENSKLNKNEDCQEKEGSVKSTRSKCPNRKVKKNVKPQTSKFEINDFLSKIKPPISVRQKYFNPQHVVCFLEGTQNISSQKQNGIIYATAESKPCEGKMKKSNPKEVSNADNSWCETSTKEKSSKSMDLNCDSVCSFDSVIDLQGFALTKEEFKKIAKNRLRLHPSKENKDANEERKKSRMRESKEKEANEGEVKDDQDNIQDNTEADTKDELPAETKVPDETDNE